MIRRLWVQAAVCVAWSAFAHAGDFEIAAEKKKVEGERSTTVSTSKSEEQWAYHVTVTNTSFKEVTGIEVKYLIFGKQEIAGAVKEKPKEERDSGSTTIDSLKNGMKFQFDTKTMEFTKSQLAGGWTYTNGAKPRSKGSLTGVWVRLYQGTNMLAEYSNPPALKTTQKW